MEHQFSLGLTVVETVRAGLPHDQVGESRLDVTWEVRDWGSNWEGERSVQWVGLARSNWSTWSGGV